MILGFEVEQLCLGFDNHLKKKELHTREILFFTLLDD